MRPYAKRQDLRKIAETSEVCVSPIVKLWTNHTPVSQAGVAQHTYDY
jgi:hypothetical protein